MNQKLSKLLIGAVLLSSCATAQAPLEATPVITPESLAVTLCNRGQGVLLMPGLCEAAQDISYFVTDSTADMLLCANILLNLHTPKRKHCFILGTPENVERTAKLAKSIAWQGINVYLLQENQK